MTNNKLDIEEHPLFPSGQWEGFYLYKTDKNNEKHEMAFELDFMAGKVHGSGFDNIGEFDWSGTYDTERLCCEMTKQYIGRHTVWCQGEVDENGIWGIWLIPPFRRGGFHVWPKGFHIKEGKTKTVTI